MSFGHFLPSICLIKCFVYIQPYIECFLLHTYIDVGIHTPYNGITILQGDDVTLSCTPSVSDIALQWSYNDDDISSSPNHHFAPPFLNHNLTIANANDIDSGNYVCAFKLKSRVIAQRNINLIVVPSKFDYNFTMNF